MVETHVNLNQRHSTADTTDNLLAVRSDPKTRLDTYCKATATIIKQPQTA